MKRLLISFAIFASVTMVTAAPPQAAATDAEIASRADAYMSALSASAYLVCRIRSKANWYCSSGVVPCSA